MTETEPLNPDLVRRYLEEDGAEYEVDEDGSFVFSYDYEEDCACELTAYLSIEEGDTYSIDVANERNFPRSEWDRFLNLCNEWNETQRYPTAYLNTEDMDPDEVDIHLDYYVYLPSGATQQQIRDLTEEIIEKSFAFWQWAHQEHGL